MNFTFTPGSRRQMIGCLYGDVHLNTEVPAMADMLMEDKYIDLKKLISREFTLDEINEAYDATEKRKIIGRWVCSFD